MGVKGRKGTRETMLGTGVGIFLMSRLQNHDEAGTVYAERELQLVDSEEMF